jgi:hypothetical protein
MLVHLQVLVEYPKGIAIEKMQYKKMQYGKYTGIL